MHHLRFAVRPWFLVAAIAAMLLSRTGWASAGGALRACSGNGGRKPQACVESCPVRASAPSRPSELFLDKLRALPSVGHHARVLGGGALASAASQFRVASVPFSKEAAARWRQNGLWAGPCAGLTTVFVATALDDRDPRKVIDLYELRYGSEVAAHRVAALLGNSWDWNGHPFIAVQQGANVMVAEGRFGAWGTLEKVAAHFAGPTLATGGAAPLAFCDKGPARRPLFQQGEDADGLAVHVLGFAPSGELAWLEAASRGGETVWTLRVTNLVNDREVAARTYRTAEPGPEAFCAQHRGDASQLLAQHAISGGTFATFASGGPDGEPLGVVIRLAPSGATEVVIEGRAGTKVLGRLPASISAARALGFIRSPFEERVAVLVLGTSAASQRASVRVLGGRLDKRWVPRPAALATTAVR